MKPVRIPICLLAGLLFAFVSCKENASNTAGLYLVNKCNYQNSLNVVGFLEAENLVNIACPRLFSDLTVKYLVEDGAMIHPGDTVCILDAPEVKTKYENALKDLEIAKTEYVKSLENLNLQVLLLESQLNTLDATTQISKLDSLQKKYSTELSKQIIDLEIQKTELEKKKLENKLGFLKQINQSELEKLKLRIKQSENKVNQSEDILNKLIITAENEGLVIRQRAWSTGQTLREGDIIWNGQPIVKIPDMSSLQANLVLSESHFKRISKNQKVELKVDSRPNLVLTGKIKKKKGGGRPIERRSPIKVYDAIASIDSLDVQLQPGINVTANVFVEELADTFAIPITCVFEADSNKVVYVKENNKFRAQIVEMATHSITQAVISSGLEGNETISTYKPPSKKIQ